MSKISQINPDESVVVALGSSLAGEHASCEALLDAALARFPAHGLTVLTRSSWWRSAAWPDPSAPGFVNGVALVATELSPAETLAALHAIEREFGRVRAEPNAPRTLDLDLIAHGRTVSDDAALILPHPRAHERLFVMGPLAEIAPDWLHPVSRLVAGRLAMDAPLGRDARPAPEG